MKQPFTPINYKQMNKTKKTKKFEQYKQELAGWEDALLQNSFDEKVRFIFEDGEKRFLDTLDENKSVLNKGLSLLKLAATSTAICGALCLVYSQFLPPFLYSWAVVGILLYGMRGRPYHAAGSRPRKWLRDKYQNHDMRKVYAEEIQMLHIKISHNGEINEDRYRYVKVGAILLWLIPAVIILSFIIS